MHCTGEGKKKRMKKAVGSVAKKAAEGADSLLSEARKDVVAARSPERVTPVEFEKMAEALEDVKATVDNQKDVVLKDTTKLVNSLSFATGSNKKMDKQFVMESINEIKDTPLVESKQSVAEFIADLHRTQVDEESKPLLSQNDFKKLTAFASPEPREMKNEGGEMEKEIVIETYPKDSDEAKYLRFEKSYEEAMAKAETKESKEIITKRFNQIKNSFEPNVIVNAMKSKETPEDRKFRLAEEKERFGYDMGGILSKPDEDKLEGDLTDEEYEKLGLDDREKKFLGGIFKKIIKQKKGVDFPSGGSGFMAIFNKPQKVEPATADIKSLEGVDPLAPSNNALAEGGMPVDTYSNIPEEEKAAVEASQLPDAEMEDEYMGFILDEALNEQDQDYLLDALEGDERLGSIFDNIMDIAGEFAGEGAVKGLGTGTSDSIPARLSDGEFVFTKKAVDHLGVDALQKMMDDAERAYDGGLMKKYMGGGILDAEEMDEDVKSQMLLSNPMPSVRKR